jgi:hypothetical protein
MAEADVEIVRTMIEAFRRRDNETVESLMSPEIEWDATRMAGVLPDLAGGYSGPEARGNSGEPGCRRGRRLSSSTNSEMLGARSSP